MAESAGIPPDRTRLVFRMGDAFPPGDVLGSFVLSLSSSLNDLIFITRLLVPGGDDSLLDDDDLLAGERLFLLRQSASHVYELHELITNARRKYPEVVAFLEALPVDARRRLNLLESVTREPDPDDTERTDTTEDLLRKTLKMTRHRTRHLATPGNDELRKILRTLEPFRATLAMSDSVASFRAVYADDVMTQFATWYADDYKTLSDVVALLRDLTIDMIYLIQHVLLEYLERVYVRRYDPHVPIPDDEVAEYESERPS